MKGTSNTVWDANGKEKGNARVTINAHATINAHVTRNAHATIIACLQHSSKALAPEAGGKWPVASGQWSVASGQQQPAAERSVVTEGLRL